METKTVLFDRMGSTTEDALCFRKSSSFMWCLNASLACILCSTLCSTLSLLKAFPRRIESDHKSEH